MILEEDQSFKNNPNLKQPGVKIECTPEQMIEIMKCQKDMIYFIENYVKIVTLDNGEQPFKLFDYQIEFLNNIDQNRFSAARWARQMGKSTTCAAYFVWKIIFEPKFLIAIMANKAETSQEILFRVKEMYESVPVWMQQGVLSWNVKSIILENKSRILAAATSSSAIRGKTVNILFIDEVAHIPKKMWDAFYLSSFPTITSGKTTKMVLVSTPKGLNHFYEIYIGAPENGFVVSDATWERHPFRDQTWLEHTKSKITEEQFAQEFECSWLGSSYSLINPGTLSALRPSSPKIIKENLWIFEEPIREVIEKRAGKDVVTVKGGQYIITADVSEGLGMDHSAFSVMKLVDVKQGLLQQVASFKDNRIDPVSYASVLHRIGMFYNAAHILVESNDTGKLVIRHLKIDLEYPNLIRTKQEIDPAFPNKHKGRDYGLRVNKRTKRIGCINFKMFVERKRIILSCSRTIEEIKHFVRPPDVAERDGTYKAEEGHNDDLTMGLVNLSFLFSTKTFEHMFDSDNLIEMFKESVEDSRISKELDDIYVPIIAGAHRANVLDIVNNHPTFRNVNNLEKTERDWFLKG